MAKRHSKKQNSKLLLLFVVALLLCVLCYSCARVVGLMFAAPAGTQQSPTTTLGSGSTTIAAGGTTTSTTATQTTTGTTTVMSAVPTVPSEFADTDYAALSLSASHVFVFDEEEQLLFCKGGMNDRIYPASITKLFTAYVALKYLDPAAVITVGAEQQLVSEGSSIAFIAEGQRLRVDMLVEGMLLPSGNDAAYALAAAAGRVVLGDTAATAEASVKAFVDAMNSYASALGMKGTHFQNPDGFHDTDHYTTMADLVKVAQLALGNEVIMRYTSLREQEVYFESGEHCTWRNSNALLFPDYAYYRQNVIGLKTGHTDPAGHCLLAAAKAGDKTVIVGVLGGSSSETRFADAAALIDIATK